MSRTNETRYTEWHKTCKCKCRLDASVCINKQRWNEDKCKCECKWLIDKGICNKRCIWDTSNCEHECDKSCNVKEYREKCRKSFIDKLVEECIENINEKELHLSEMIYNSVLNVYEKICSSCTLYIVLCYIFRNKYKH